MNNVRERCLTGIEALDNILNGGIPKGNTVLITGSAGTGKTTLSIEFLVHGALAGEKGLYISVTEASEKLLENLINYDFFSKEMIQKGIIFVDIPEIYEKL
ncbi:MAG: ATPase domain-containing protein, partial [Thermoplasmata archaeon]